VGYDQTGLHAVPRPLDVCLLLDDVHEVPDGSPGAELLAALARALPATAHLVLSGRVVPGLHRRRTSALAQRFGRELTEDLHGWPALIGLSLTAGPAASWRYAAEEVLSRLFAPTRETLAALVILGTATAAEVGAVAGVVTDVEHLVRTVPLVDRLDDGRFRAHDLWASVLPTGHLRAKAAEVLVQCGELAGAGRVACRAGDWTLLARLAVELVRTTLSVLPSATARRWLEAVPAHQLQEPAFLLLTAAVRHADDFADPAIDCLVDTACAHTESTKDRSCRRRRRSCRRRRARG
jgi:LuxR family maltose regulon positive regulatory protein